MSVEETLKKWDRIIGQVPYCRDDPKLSQAPVHMPVPHPDRDPKSKDSKIKTLVCPEITWADLNEVMEFVRAQTKETEIRQG
jgi:hypothetical protein